MAAVFLNLFWMLNYWLFFLYFSGSLSSSHIFLVDSFLDSYLLHHFCFVCLCVQNKTRHFFSRSTFQPHGTNVARLHWKRSYRRWSNCMDFTPHPSPTKEVKTWCRRGYRNCSTHTAPNLNSQHLRMEHIALNFDIYNIKNNKNNNICIQFKICIGKITTNSSSSCMHISILKTINYC